MAYKVSYKVVSEQGEQLKNTAKDMENYITSMNQIISKLGNDELLQSVRADLKKFSKQLEEEKTFLNLAGQILIDVVQSYSGAEKKSVQKVDKAKAHNRDFYKRPVTVASAGGGAAVASSAGATAVNISGSNSVRSTVVTQEINTTNIFVSAPESMPVEQVVSSGSTGANAAALGATGILAAGGVIAGAAVADELQKKKEKLKSSKE